MSIFLKGEISSQLQEEEGEINTEKSVCIWSGKWRFVKEKKEQDFEYKWISDEIPYDLMQFVSFLSVDGTVDARGAPRRRKKRKMSRHSDAAKLKMNGKNNETSLSNDINSISYNGSSINTWEDNSNSLVPILETERSLKDEPPDDENGSSHVKSENFDIEESIYCPTGPGLGDETSLNGQVDNSEAIAESGGAPIDETNEEDTTDTPAHLNHIKIDRSDPLFGLWQGYFNVEMVGSESISPIEEKFFLYAYSGTPHASLPEGLSILPPEQMYSLPLLLNMKPKELKHKLSVSNLQTMVVSTEEPVSLFPPIEANTKPADDNYNAIPLETLSVPISHDAHQSIIESPILFDLRDDEVIDTNEPPANSAKLTEDIPSLSLNSIDTEIPVTDNQAPSSSSRPLDENAVTSSEVILGFGCNVYGRYSLSCILDRDGKTLRCEKRYMMNRQGNSRKFKPKFDPMIEEGAAALNGTTDYGDVKRKRTPKNRYLPVFEEDFIYIPPTISELPPQLDDSKKIIRAQQKPTYIAHDEKHFRDAFFDETTGEIYEGDCLGYARHGRGVCLYPDGTMYEGGWERGLEHGKGKLMRGENRDTIYAGNWFEGQICGTGVYYYSNGDKYTGEFRDGTRNGFGEYVTSDGNKYVGDWVNNMRHGRGTFTWSNGSFYEGEWEYNYRHGRGTLDIVGGLRYEGSWVKNYMDGKGVSEYAGGQVYQGSYRQGLREGRGSVSFIEGANYEGRFRDDKIDGQGTLHLTSIVPGVEDGEVMIPVQIQADLKRIHSRAGFGDDSHGH